jgi:hypothetical protein
MIDMVRVTLVATAALVLTLATPAAAAPTITLQAPPVQRPDLGWGTTWDAKCSSTCNITFSGQVVRDGQPLTGIGNFPPFTAENVAPDNEFWFYYRWYLREQKRLARALRAGPVGLRIDATASDATGSTTASITLQLRRPKLPPPARRLKNLDEFIPYGPPFRLPTPRGYRWINPGRVVPLDDSDNNIALVRRSARLPAVPAWLEWTFGFEAGIGAADGLERRAREMAAGEVASRSRPRLVSRRPVDEAKTFRFAIGTDFLVTVAFYGDFAHTVTAKLPPGANGRRSMRSAYAQVLRGASLAW